MDKITTYVVGFLLTIFFSISTVHYNTVSASSLDKKTAVKKRFKKKQKHRRFHVSGCHNLSRIRLNSKAKRFRKNIARASKRYNVSPNLIKAIITTESCFRPRARGTSGEKGLMQIMYATGKRFNIKNRYSPRQNIRGGTKYLAYLLKRYNGSKRHAVAAYNTGEGRIRKNGYIPNKTYVYKVMTAYHKFNRSKFRKKSFRQQRSTYQKKRLRIKGKYYTIKSGDTLSKIARHRGVSTKSLIKINRLKKPYTLKIGRNIYFHKPSKKHLRKYKQRSKKYSRLRNKGLKTRKSFKTKKRITSKRHTRKVKVTKKRYYKVNPGDTLYSVMRKTQIPVKQLIRKNHLKKPYTLRINQKLRLK